MVTSIDKARGVKSKIRSRIGRDADIAGIGISKIGADYCVKVNLRRDPHRSLPETIDGVRIKYEVVGEIRSLTG